MLQPQGKCLVCKAIERNPKLLKELYTARYYMKSTGPSLVALAKKYHEEFTYDSLQTHVKNHQTMTEKDLDKAHLRSIVKTAEKKLIMKKLDNIGSVDIWDHVLKQGLEDLNSGKMSVSTKDLLKANKDKADYQLKVGDQKLAMMEMMAHFASGESDTNESAKYDRKIIEGEALTDYDPSGESAADSERRAEQSRAFYQSIAGDSVPSGSN